MKTEKERNRALLLTVSGRFLEVAGLMRATQGALDGLITLETKATMAAVERLALDGAKDAEERAASLEENT